MAMRRVTMQEIAAACGLSRNTVSKVFNGRGSVPDTTRNLVLAKARELGYFSFTEEERPEPKPSGTIALLTQHKLLSHNFGAFFITSFTDQISRSGYTMKMFEVSPSEIAARQLPPNFDLEHTVGILGIELFDKNYLDMIFSLNKPTVFVDGYARANHLPIKCDFVSMENVASEEALVNRMIAGGAKRIGFIGDIEHCNSFYERWEGYCAALENAGLAVDKDICILEKDSDLYGNIEWVRRRLDAMPYMPDAFACANDFLAIHLMSALKKMSLSIPEDVMVTGFDGSLEAAVIDPPLTTVEIASSEIGKLAAFLLDKRIELPDFPYHWTYVKSEPVWGQSTL